MTDSQALSEINKEGGSIQAAVDKIRGLLTPGEALQCYAVEVRWFALFRRRTVVAASSNRLLVFRRPLFGGFDMEDLHWQDLSDVRLTEAMLGSTLTILKGGHTILVKNLRKDQAQAVYVACQGQEQAWREKNRVRQLEEMRAQSGGVQLGGLSNGAFGGTTTDGPEGAMARLEKAKGMLDKGLISEAEYESIKSRVIEKL